MELSICNLGDIGLLAKLNLELFEDEQNDNLPTIDILEERLKIAMMTMVLNSPIMFLIINRHLS